MPYLGKSPSSGVRTRFVYAATAGQTSFSGNDSAGISLAYDDNLYLDVYQNGVLLKPVTDYASTTGTSVVLTTGASTDDVVEMIVYDSFAVADTVSAANGGTFSGNMAMGGTLSVAGITTATGGLNVGTIKDAGNNATAMTIDSDGVVKIPQAPCFFITGSNAAYVNTSPIPFGATAIDTRSGVDLSNNKYVVPVAGKWHFHIQLGIVQVTGAGYTYPKIRRTTSGGTATDFGYSYYAPTNSSSVQSYSHSDVDAFIDCAVGDSIDVIFFQSSGTYYNGTSECRFFGHFLG